MATATPVDGTPPNARAAAGSSAAAGAPSGEGPASGAAAHAAPAAPAAPPPAAPAPAAPAPAVSGSAAARTPGARGARTAGMRTTSARGSAGPASPTAAAGRAPRPRGGRPEPYARRLAGALRRYAWVAPLLPAVATVLLLALPVSDGDVSASGKVTPADVASAVLVATCAVRLLRARRRVLAPAAAVVLGAPLAGFAVAAVTSLDPGAGLTGFLRYAQVFVLVPASVALLLRDRRDFAVVAGSIVALALAQGAVGVWQYATGTGASYAGQDIRAVGTFGPADVMDMATVVAYGLVVAAAYALAPGPRRLRLGALGCAAALVVPLAVSFSRGTWIATALACAVVIALAGLRQAVRVAAVLGACAVLLVGGLGVGSQAIGARLSSITQVTAAPDPSVTDRYALWAAALSMWREHPVTGVGLKRFPDERDGHASLALSSGSDTAGAGQSFRREPLLSPHNMYLLALSEQGLVGCAPLTASWAALLAAGLARLAGRRGRAGRAAARPGRTGRGGPAACGLAAVGLLVWQCVDFLYADIGGPTTVLTATLLGLAAWWALAPAPALPDGTRRVRRGGPRGGVRVDGTRVHGTGVDGTHEGPYVRPSAGPYEAQYARPYEGPRR